MERNFVYRLCTLVGPVLLNVLMLPSLLGAAEGNGNAGMKGSDTPQAVVTTYRHALATKDWRGCFLCYDPKMRGESLCEMFRTIGWSRDAELAAIAKKRMRTDHTGGDETTIPGPRPDARVSRELRAYEYFQKEVDDLPRFVDEMCRRLDAMGQTWFPEVGDVREISIHGDIAKGYWDPRSVKATGPAATFNGSTPTDNADSRGTPVPAAPSKSDVAGVQGQPARRSDNQVPIHFRRISGRWYMTIPDPPPPLSASERAKLLQSEVESLWIVVCRSPGAVKPVDEANKSRTARPFSERQCGELRMSVRPFVYQSNDPNVHLARLTEAQAKKLIDYLAAEGFLQQAVELGKQEVPDRDPYEKCYTIQVSTQKLHLDEDRGWVPALQLHEDLGWGPATLKRLDGLRRALDGEAARAMDSFLAGLADDRNKWAAGAAEPAQPRGEKPAIPRQHVPVPNPEK